MESTLAACAQHVVTGQIHAAADLKMDAELRSAAWQCPGCQVQMVAAAVDPGKTFARVPYFRAEPGHHAECNVEGILDLVHPKKRLAPQKRDALAAMAPTALRLRDLRPQVAGDQQAPARPVVQQPGARGPRPPGDPNREQVTGSLALIARHYALLPMCRKFRLRIEGVQGTTYSECIQPLQNFAGEPPQLPHCVLHVPIAFAAAGVVGAPDVFEIPLHRGRWMQGEEDRKGRFDPRYRVQFDTTHWRGRQIQALRESADAWIAEQRKLATEKIRLDVHLFFLGRRDPTDLTRFIVPDWRLACFQTML